MSSPGESRFQTEVLDASREHLVVVDFWAEWCAPCRALGPTLDREVKAPAALVKVNVDESPELGQRFEVQGIPAVKAFRNGEVVGEFVGARDAAFVRRWLEELSPSAAASALAAADTEPKLRALLEDPEVGLDAALRLSEHVAPAEASALLERIPAGHRLAERAAALRGAVAFALEAEQFGGLAKARAAVAANGKDPGARYALAAALMAAGQHEAALEELLTLVSLDRKFRDDGGRKAMVQIFAQLGPAHSLTRAFQRRLQIVL